MQGKQVFQRKLFYQVQWEQMVPKNHLLRRIDEVLDLNFIRELTAPFYCEKNGRPSVDPEVFFRMQLISYLYAIPSDRRLCEEIQVNLAYRWFLKMSLEESVPDHSSLGKIRDRLGEETFKAVFDQVLEQCRAKGLMEGKRFYTDSTMIVADAAKSSMVKRENPEAEIAQSRGFERKHSNQTHVSPVDSEATLSGRPGYGGKLYHKAHAIIDEKSRVIVDVHVTSGVEGDSNTFVERLKSLKETKRFSPEEVIADRGYGRGPVYDYCEENKIRTYISLKQEEHGAPPAGFEYDTKRDEFICPRGERLTHTGTHEDLKFYRTRKKACKKCPLQEICFAGLKKESQRKISKSVHFSSLRKVFQRQSTSYFRSRLKKRMWFMEGIFAEAKEQHGMRRARYRGRAKVQIQAYMTAVVQNLKRLAAPSANLITEFLRLFFATQIKWAG